MRISFSCFAVALGLACTHRELVFLPAKNATRPADYVCTASYDRPPLGACYVSARRLMRGDSCAAVFIDAEVPSPSAWRNIHTFYVVENVPGRSCVCGRHALISTQHGETTVGVSGHGLRTAERYRGEIVWDDAGADEPSTAKLTGLSIAGFGGEKLYEARAERLIFDVLKMSDEDICEHIQLAYPADFVSRAEYDECVDDIQNGSEEK